MEEDRICGANAVAALFARRPDAAKRLFYAAAAKELAGPFCAAMARMRRPYRMLDEAELAKAAGSVHHGGIVAVAERRHVAWFDAADPPRLRLLLVLDRVGNPHNLGAIARSAAFFGVGAMLLHDVPGAATPSDAAYRTAEGGLEHLALFRTRDLRRALSALDPFYRTVASSLAPDALALADLPRDRPVALVLGNEEGGVSPAATAACRRRVRIVGTGAVQSLNVAQAAAVLMAALA
jgi:TrmH RNA methyltransferase